MAVSYNDAKNQWQQVFTQEMGRNPYDEDLNDFENKWKQTSDYRSSQGLSDGQEGVGIDRGARDWSGLLSETQGDLRTRANSGGDRSAGGYDTNLPDSVSEQWNTHGGSGGNGGGAAEGSANSILQQMMARLTEQDAQNRERGNSLFATLMERANQSKVIDPNDPVIRAQSDAFAGAQERSRRNYLSDTAERSGPYANLQGERRMASERTGQAIGGFKAGLMGQELAAKRQEIAQALAGAQGMLSGDQTRQLQGELAILDNAIREKGLGLQSAGLTQDWNKALMNNDQFLRTLGLNAWDRENYWDVERSRL